MAANETTVWPFDKLCNICKKYLYNGTGTATPLFNIFKFLSLLFTKQCYQWFTGLCVSNGSTVVNNEWEKMWQEAWL